MQTDNAPPKSATVFAQSGTKNTIPEVSQIGVMPGAASFEDGFPPLTMTPLAAGGVPPSGQDFNGILHFLSNAVRWNQIGAGYPFDAAFAAAIGGYPKGAVVRSSDGLTLWISQTDHNMVNPNAGTSGQWQSIKSMWPNWNDVANKPNLPSVYSITALPTSNIGPITVAEAAEVWVWVNTAYYTGYRSPLCGRPVDGHTLTPLASEIDAVGGLLSKSAYAGLWGYAQENGLVTSQYNWQSNIGAHYFVDVSSTQFRVPDLRNQFRRFTGTDADSGNIRWFGTKQRDALQNIYGSISSRAVHTLAGVIAGANGAFVYERGEINNVEGSGHVEIKSDPNIMLDITTFNASRVARTSTETRPVNTAYHPRIHI